MRVRFLTLLVMIMFLYVPGERHDAVDHHRNPHQKGDGDLPGTKLAQLLKAVIVIHNLSQKW